MVACRRYEAESAIRLGLPYEPSAAVTSAVEICDEIAGLLSGRADEECEEHEDDFFGIVDEYNSMCVVAPELSRHALLIGRGVLACMRQNGIVCRRLSQVTVAYVFE